MMTSAQLIEYSLKVYWNTFKIHGLGNILQGLNEKLLGFYDKSVV